MKNPILPFLFLAPLWLPGASAQITAPWIPTTGGSWSDPLLWEGGLPPNGEGDTARFNVDFTGTPAVTLDHAAGYTLNQFYYDDTGASADSNMNVNAGTGGFLKFAGTTPLADTRTGTVTMNAPVTLAPGFGKAGAGILTLAGPVTSWTPDLVNGVTAGTLRLGTGSGVAFDFATTSKTAGAGIVQFDSVAPGSLVLPATYAVATGAITLQPAAAMDVSAGFAKTGNGTLNLNPTSLTAGGTFNIGGGILSLGGAVTGTGLTKTGNGTLVLNSANFAVTGPAAVNGGVLQVTGGATNTAVYGTVDAIAGSSISVASGGILDLPRTHANNAQNVTWSLPPLNFASGSRLRFRATTGTSNHTLAPAISATGEVTIENTGSAYGHDIKYNGVLSGSGQISYLATSNSSQQVALRILELTQPASPYTGNWFVDYTVASSDDSATLRTAAAGSLGTGTVTLGRRATLTSVAGLADAFGGLAGVTLQQSTAKVILTDSSHISALNGAGGVVSGPAGAVLTVGEGTYAGSIEGGLDLVKTSAGTLTLAGSYLATGGVTVNGGTLKWGNAATALASVTLPSFVQNEGDVHFDIAGSSSDQLQIAGNYTRSGGGLIVELGSAPVLGMPYTLVSYGGTLNSQPPVTFAGLGDTRVSGAVNYGSGSNSAITVTFSGTSGQLVWSGATNALWDVNQTANWLNGAAPDKYLQFDQVTFPNVLASGRYAPELQGVISPGHVIFDNSANDYTLTGSGSLGGAALLTKRGTGKVSLTTNNTYSGATTIEDGTLEVGDGGTSGTLGTGPISNQGMLSFNRGDTVNLTAAVDGVGGLAQAGPGRLVLLGANTYAGHTLISNGVLQVGDGAANTSGTQIPGPLISVQGPGVLELPRLHAMTEQVTSWLLPEIQLLNGSSLRFRSLVGTSSHTVSSEITVSGSVIIDNNGGAYEQKINLQGPLQGAGMISLLATSASSSTAAQRPLHLINSGNSFSGTWLVDYTAATTDDFVSLHADAEGSLGTGSVILDDRARLYNNVTDGLKSLADIMLQTSTSSVHLAANTVIAKLNGSAGTVTAAAIGGELTVQSGDFSGSITGGLSLVKTTTGTLTLGAPGTYTGSTVVQQGQLVLTTQALPESTAVNLKPGGTLALNFTGANRVAGLLFNNVNQAEGEWGALDSTAPNKTAFITGPGRLVVGLSPYADWASSFALDPLTNGAPGADADRDGLNNLGEFALNSSPVSGSASGKISARVATVGGSRALTLTLPVRNGAVFTGSTFLTGTADGVVYRIEGSSALAEWESLDISEVTPALTEGLPATGSGWQYRTFRTPGEAGVTPPEFIRVKLSPAP